MSIAAKEIYRRLPGRRRGMWNKASMWMGSDHLLLVKSSWFREEYKRFYLRDIQAIVVAPCARFPISTPVLLCALVWLVPGLGAAFWPPGMLVVWAVGGLTMLVTWLSVSATTSCRTRLYTAVSRDDLPSLYRTWTARKFLNQVRPRIDLVQGKVDAGWAETERSNAGPAATPLLSAESPAPAALAQARSHTLASDLFVLSLFVSALVGLITVRSHTAAWLRVNTGMTLVELVGAIAVLVQYSRGSVRRAMQRLAIAALVLIGLMFYVRSFTLQFANLNSQAMNTMPLPLTVIHQTGDGLGLMLGFIGVAIILRGEGRPS